MQIVKPSYEIEAINGLEMLRKIEKAGRVCYKSEDKITDESAPKFVAGILKRGHESVIEHEKVSVRIICDRGVTHEIVRHRLASYSQESTRYCNYSGGVAFIAPCWLEFPDELFNEEISSVQKAARSIELSSDARSWMAVMLFAEHSYKRMLKDYGWSAQWARSVLPNSLKTEIVMTCNLREWRHFFNLRTAKAAHPQMREIAVPMLKEFKQLIPIIFDDIAPYEEK